MGRRMNKEEAKIVQQLEKILIVEKERNKMLLQLEKQLKAREVRLQNRKDKNA
jgi:hypothetical protein